VVGASLARRLDLLSVQYGLTFFAPFPSRIALLLICETILARALKVFESQPEAE
jgi:hypothetical protein